MTLDSLSQRGKNLAETPARVDMDLWFEAAQNLYCPDTNPGGAFPLNVAENIPMTGMIREKLDSIAGNSKIPEWVLQYTEPRGNPGVREVMAGFMERQLCRCPVHPDSIGFSAGAAAVIEATSFLLAEPGDVAVIPAPAYPVYSGDLGIKSGMERYNLQTHFDIAGAGDRPPLSVHHLEEAKKEIEKGGKRFRLLVITSPDNPTGWIYSAEQLRSMAEWCVEHRVHMAVNEIYALSRIRKDDPEIAGDYTVPDSFISFALLMGELKSDYLHYWYALSKDFAMSGMRFGIVHSLNEYFLQAFGNVNIPHMVSNLTQWITGEMFRDEEFIRDYLKRNRDRLTEHYKVVVRFLKKMDIPYIPAGGSLFVWADFSKYLKEDSEQGQEQLWEEIYRNSGVLLTPGAGFGHNKKGLFRIVHTAVPLDHLAAAMTRLEKYLGTGNG